MSRQEEQALLTSWMVPEDAPGHSHFDAAVLEKRLAQIEQSFRRHLRGDGNITMLSKYASQYLDRAEAVLYQRKVIPEESLVLFHIRELLASGRKGKKHPLSDPEASPQDHRSNARSLIEAEAAAILACAIWHGGGEQARWLRTICNTLKTAQFWRNSSVREPSRPYTKDAIRKWQEACHKGDHSSSAHYYGLLKCYGYDGYCPEAGLVRLKHILARGRW